MFKSIAKTARKYKICPEYADFDFGGEVKDLQEVQIAAEEEILLNENFKQDEPDELEIQAGDDGAEVEAGWGYVRCALTCRGLILNLFPYLDWTKLATLIIIWKLKNKN